MNNNCEFNPDTGCLIITGELTIYQANATAEELRGAYASGALKKIDLSRVTELDTAGLQLLLVAERLPGNEETVVLVNYSEPVQAVLKLAGVRR